MGLTYPLYFTILPIMIQIRLHSGNCSWELPTGEYGPLPPEAWKISKSSYGKVTSLVIPIVCRRPYYTYIDCTYIYDFNLGHTWLNINEKATKIDCTSIENLRKSLIFTLANIETENILSSL